MRGRQAGVHWNVLKTTEENHHPPIHHWRISRVVMPRAYIERILSSKPVQRVNVDFTASMLEELDAASKELNISRQAVIKTLIRQALDRRHLARSSRRR